MADQTTVVKQASGKKRKDKSGAGSAASKSMLSSSGKRGSKGAKDKSDKHAGGSTISPGTENSLLKNVANKDNKDSRHVDDSALESAGRAAAFDSDLNRKKHGTPGGGYESFDGAAAIGKNKKGKSQKGAEGEDVSIGNWQQLASESNDRSVMVAGQEGQVSISDFGFIVEVLICSV